MNSKHVLPIFAESFVLLVTQLRAFYAKADIFEIHVDKMKVKGDLAVIKSNFKKPFIAKTISLDLMKRAIIANFDYADLTHDFTEDMELKNLIKNKKTKIIRSFHDFEKTPTKDELIKILEDLDKRGADLLKISTQVLKDSDNDILLSLLEEEKYKNRLIITGMGDLARRTRIEAPLKGSVFFYAPLDTQQSSAEGQLTIDELEKEWAKG